MITSNTPETDAAWDKYINPPYTYGAGDLRILAQRIERERDQSNAELSNKYVEYDKLFDEAYQIRIERDEARKIAERAIDDLAWFSETNAQRLHAELDRLKEGAK